jgi:hypothetical protein
MVCIGGTSCVELCGASGRCSIPTVIPAAGGVFAGTTVGGTSKVAACGTFASPERTFEWTPATSGTATISTCGTNFDTVLSIRTGGCPGTQVACNDDGCSLQSSVSTAVTAGTTYTIVVDGFDAGESGPFTLTVDLTP